MRTSLLLAFATSIAFISPGHADGPPPEWELLQNDPNPFCGETVIDFTAPQRAEIQLRVWNSDSTEVVRTLIEGILEAGYYRILWDQLDDDGVELPSADYPYQLLAVDPDTGGVLFEAWLVATVDCDPTPVLIESWGRIKGAHAIER